MKYLISIIILIAFQSKGQSYTVIHSIGKILDTETGTYLTKGSKVAEDSRLKFETDGARAAVLSNTNGRFVIQQNVGADSKSDVIYALSSVISPVRGRLSTRSGAINNSLDFRKYFDDGPVAFIGNTYIVDVSPSGFPMNDRKFFYTQYLFNEELVNKKLEASGDQLIFDLDKFYTIDQQAIDPSMVANLKLFYYEADAQKSSFITNMNVVYIPKDELRSLNDEFANTEKDALLELINSMYGKCSAEQLDRAINEL